MWQMIFKEIIFIPFPNSLNKAEHSFKTNLVSRNTYLIGTLNQYVMKYSHTVYLESCNDANPTYNCITHVIISQNNTYVCTRDVHTYHFFQKEFDTIL